MPRDVRAIDLMMAIPDGDPSRWYAFLKSQTRDPESKGMKMPAGYMFKDIPDPGPQDDFVAYTLAQMDRFGIERAMLGVSDQSELTQVALKEHPDRFLASYEVDPNGGMDAVRELERMHRDYGIVAATAFPAGCRPQVPINDKAFYPIYTKCVELDIPICVCAGVPGPRVPMHCQHVEHLDEVCWYFPELTLITFHGCEPWEELAVKLMLKWPGLHYATSAFAPKYYPKAIVDYANTRGADKILYAGYFPMGLTLERIMTEMKDVPFRDHVWPKFLRENALRVLKLDA